MTTMQWIGFSIGALLLATRLPGLIWPGSCCGAAVGGWLVRLSFTGA